MKTSQIPEVTPGAWAKVRRSPQVLRAALERILRTLPASDSSRTLRQPSSDGARRTAYGSTTFSSNGGVGSFNSFGSSSAPFIDLSAGYEALLGGGVFGSAADTMTLTLAGLSVGQVYQFQWWVNDSRVAAGPHRQSVATTSGGLSASLEHNFQNVEGGVGQFVIGTFTADSASQVIQFTGATTGVTGPSPQINALSTPGDSGARDQHAAGCHGNVGFGDRPAPRKRSIRRASWLLAPGTCAENAPTHFSETLRRAE